MARLTARPRAVGPVANVLSGGAKPEHRTWSSCEQAYVPAEQPTAREDARVPAAHADPRRTRRPGRAAAQGPRAGQCLISPRRPTTGKVLSASRTGPDAAAGRVLRGRPWRQSRGPSAADWSPAGAGRQ